MVWSWQPVARAEQDGRANRSEPVSFASSSTSSPAHSDGSPFDVRQQKHWTAMKAIGKVFVSHSSSDKVFVDRLVADLAKHGIPVWYDKLDIKLGDSVPG